MAKTGSINKRLTNSAQKVAKGRNNMLTAGKEVKGRVTFSEGIAEATKAFQDAKATNDKAVIVKAEFIFAVQDYSLRNVDNAVAAANLRKGIQDIQDSLLFLTATPEAFKGTNLTISSKDADRTKGGYPYDAFHKCLASQITRLKNSLGSNIPSPAEITLVNQRIENLEHARKLHLENQASIMPKRKREKEIGD